MDATAPSEAESVATNVAPAPRKRARWEPLAKSVRQQPPSIAKLHKLFSRNREQRIVAVPPHDAANPQKIVTIGQTDYTVGPRENLIRLHSMKRSNKS